MRKLVVLVSSLLILAVVPAPQAAWAVTILLRVGAPGGVIQIEGESTIQGHENEIVIESLAFDVSNPAAGAPGGGGSAGRPNFSDISFVKRVDKASPKLFLAVATGQHFARARFQLLDTIKGHSLAPIFTIDLEDAIFTSFKFTGGADGLAEQVTVNFGRITIRHEASGTVATWDVLQNKQ